MEKFSIAGLAGIIKAHEQRVTSDERRFFTGVSIDSRTARPGDCFFAIAGDNFDGHDYLPDVAAKGAACAVVSKDISREDFNGCVLLKVNDTVKALGDFAKQYRRQAAFKVVAITGSVGKTTTRQITHHVLSQHRRCYQAPKNFNNNIGLPLTLLGAGPTEEVVIAEIGSSSPGEVAYLTRIAQPDIAVVTSVCPAHLSGFGNLRTIIREKLSIAQGLRSGGILVINGDSSELVDTCRADLGLQVDGHGSQVITFGKSDRCDIQAKNITYNDAASRLTIDGTQVLLPLPGRGNVENALAAWSVCSRFGLTIDDFASAVKTLPPVPMRAELLQIGTLTVLNDCYNANPVSMNNALDILANLDSSENRRLVFICGDMAELGQQAQALHAELGRNIAHAKVKLLLAVGEFAKITTRAAKTDDKHRLSSRKAGALRTKSFKDTLSACNNLEKFVKDYDILLVKGSRAAGLELVVEKLKELFE